MRVEGGPALADFQGLIETLNRSLIQTRDQPDKFERFASRVLAKSNNKASDRELLKKALSDLIDWQLKVERMNATDLRYGYGRLDVFGHIFNKVLLVANPPDAKLTLMPSDAPTSYPFLWNVPQQTYVQWNAAAPNREFKSHIPGFGQPVDTAALGRNVGEVIGVFADIRPSLDAERPGYDAKNPKFKSSIRVKSLISLEQMLTRLRPPAWPAIFGIPEPSAVAKGKTLFKDQCESCHASIDRTDLKSEIRIKTDVVEGFRNTENRFGNDLQRLWQTGEDRCPPRYRHTINSKTKHPCATWYK